LSQNLKLADVIGFVPVQEVNLIENGYLALFIVDGRKLLWRSLLKHRRNPCLALVERAEQPFEGDGRSVSVIGSEPRR
jgi:hypothetical protein